MVVRRLSSKDGKRGVGAPAPGTSVEKVFAIGLKGIMAGWYSIRVAVPDTLTGKNCAGD